ncbi:hypothetical protein Aperf_G00000061706 [Anoplocephala perfoliata]
MGTTVSPEWAVALEAENRTVAVFEVAYSWIHFYIVSVFLGFLIICVICGNALVVLAVLTERHLRVISNYLILSLAMADLLVAMVVMPLSAVHEISKVWWLGICWIIAAMVSLPARFHAGRSLEIPGVIYEGKCDINMEEGYTIYSNLLAFDLPMLFIVIMYARIYFTARRHIRKKHFTKYQTISISSASDTNKKVSTPYHSGISTSSQERRRYCCYCCGYVMETKFHKSSTMFKVGVTRCSDFQYSSSADKRTTTTSTEPPETVVAAAVTAMQIAATMIGTTKDPKWGNTECESSGSEVTFNLTSLTAVKNSNSDVESQGDDLETKDQQPLTYDVLRNLQKQKEQNSNREAIVPSLGREMVRDISIYTNPSSILFADENSNRNSLSSSMYSSVIHHSDSKEMGNGNTAEEQQVKNFTPLRVYYKKQRQQRWLAQGRVLSKKATEVMKQLSINEPDLRFRSEEERYMRERIEQKRERRTIRTLAILTGCFVLCWLPFNVHAILSPFFGRIHPIGVSILLWLGYINSLLNPIIYTIFSKEFRSAFRRIICRGPRLNCFR